MLTPKSSPRGKLLSQYVCARITSMTGIDIGLFDYDRHNALYYFIMNADEHIYMRYGGRDATSPDAYLDLDSLEVALKLGLEQHELYQQGKLEKQERPAPFFPRDIPLLRKDVHLRRRCVECHLIADFRTQELELAGKLDKLEDMFVFPDIKTIGIHLDIPEGLVVKEATGAAKQAGMEPNDLIVGIDGTPVLTFGDLQYFYDKVPRHARQVQISVERNGRRKGLTVGLPKEWWWTDLYHRYLSIDPQLYFSSRPLSGEEKREHKLDAAGFACEVAVVYDYRWARAVNVLLPGDIIYSVDGVEVDGLTQSCETYIKLNTTAGTYFTAKLLRNGGERKIQIWTGRQSFRK